MTKLTTGAAGSGKTYKLLEDVYSLISNNIANPYQILVLTLTQGEKEELAILNQSKENSKYLNIWSIEEFCRYVLKKAPSHSETTILSDLLAINIIGAICKNEFIKNTALNALTKSNSFFRELYNLFGLLKNNEISSDTLVEVIDKAEIIETDKVRLRLIAGVFKNYNEILNQYSYLDYRDVVLSVIKALEDNSILLNTIKSRFCHIFIDGFEDITYLQFKLIKLIANEDNLHIYGDKYSRIQEFRGAWRDSLILNTLKEHFDDIKTTNLESSNRNLDILDRALYLVGKYNSTEHSCEFKKSESIEYIQFEDVQSEISHIAQEIITNVKDKKCSFSDFAILIRDFESKQKFIDLFKTYGIPINSELYNEDYQNFRLNLTRYLNLCNICEKMGVESFSQKGFSDISFSSKAELEILFTELNLYISNIISEALDDHYLKDRFITIQEEFGSISLLNVIFENIDILKDNDKSKLLDELSQISKLYELYRENKLVELVVMVAKKQQGSLSSPEFSAIFAKLLSKIQSLSNLYSDVIKSRLDFNTLVELINLSFEEQADAKDAVNLLTFFKTAGFEFKYVYIPCLSENNFPKKVKSTYFITPDSNDIVSNDIKQLNKNFRSLIELDKDSIEEEARLFYLGMTRATQKLFVSTHKYEDKKQVQPSILFEILKDADGENYVEMESIEDKADESYETQKVKLEQSQIEAVLKENEFLKLSASSIGTYLSCPRKYYYANLLNLKSKSNFAASYGTIIHAVMEVFNNTCLDKYTKENLLALAYILFQSKTKPQIALESGFKEFEIALIAATDDLNIAEMREYFIDAVENLAGMNFFNNVPDSVTTEKSFYFTLEKLPGVVFDGRIDAIYEYNGKYSIVDYKTGKNKANDLDYFISENGVNFLTKTGKEPSKIQDYQKGYEYQIPLYYLACKNSEDLCDYKDKLEKLGLMYIRPSFKDEGCKEDFISADMIEMYKDKIIQNLKETVIDKIRSESEFKKTDVSWNCSNCTFAFLCDEEGEDDE